MRPFTTLRRAGGVCLCVLALTGSALADPGNGKGNGNGGTPPGQEKKAEQAPPATPAPVATAPEQQAPAASEQQANAHAQAKTQAKAKEKTKAKAQAKSEHKAAAKAKVAAKVQAKATAKAATAKPSASHGRSAEAHHHVIICHRTGSASNPYVVINIPWTAWSEAHSPDTGSHPDLDGRHDIMLKDPASRPGSKDGFTKSACGAPAAPAVVPQQSAPVDACPNIDGHQATVPPGYVKDAQGSCTLAPPQQQQPAVDVCPNLEGMQTAVPTGLVKDANGNCIAATVTAVVQSSTQVKAGPTATPAAQPTVATAAKANAAAKAQPSPAAGTTSEQPESGVLAAQASSPQDSIAETATSGTLPFTGIPLWIVALVGGGLLATGVGLRRAAQH